jgi:anti-sigma factor RsiW
MNMNPDETKLAMWLDDELSGTELAEMDAWTASQPGRLAARDELRKFRGMLAENLSASEEPPYPDFFLTRIHQGIRELEAARSPVAKTTAGSFWRSWLMPVAACAGMVLAFSMGRQSGARETSVGKKETPQTPAAPMVYTPEEGVFAEWIPTPQNHTSVILLKGVTAIPDSTDFSETVYIPTAGEYDRTATLESGSAETSAR